MCGRFTMVVEDELGGVVRAIECRAPYVADADWPARAFDALPGSVVAVLRLADAPDDASAGSAIGAAASLSSSKAVSVRGSAREGIMHGVAASSLAIVPLIWGFDLPGRGKTVFNTRSETAARSDFWRESFLRRRCVVPAHAFFEPHRSERALRPNRGAAMGVGSKTMRQTYRFSDADGGILLLAGVWAADRFSILTTQPNDAVAPVHDRMPLMLGFEEALDWLRGAVMGRADAHATERPGSMLCSHPLYTSVSEPVQQRLF
ncbi:MAG: SOS response-associated peptidase family protein [Eggerthellaceae bacterium]|nr:SOS response-associated peptidase family protein [Eggerthellaceae bacterium]